MNVMNAYSVHTYIYTCTTYICVCVCKCCIFALDRHLFYYFLLYMYKSNFSIRGMKIKQIIGIV